MLFRSSLLILIVHSVFTTSAGFTFAALWICQIIISKEMMAVIMTAMANKSNVMGALCAKSCRYSVMAPHETGMDIKVAIASTERYFLMSKG